MLLILVSNNGCHRYFTLLFKCSSTLFFVVVVKDGSPSPDELEEVSVSIGKSWRALGRRLKIDKAKLDGFDHCKWELSEKAYEMLMEWKQNEGSDTTYRVLHEALCHKFINRTDLADKICR